MAVEPAPTSSPSCRPSPLSLGLPIACLGTTNQPEPALSHVPLGNASSPLLGVDCQQLSPLLLLLIGLAHDRLCPRPPLLICHFCIRHRFVTALLPFTLQPFPCNRHLRYSTACASALTALLGALLVFTVRHALAGTTA